MRKGGCEPVLFRDFGSSHSSQPSRFGVVIATAVTLALGACAGNPPVRDRIVEVKVPVAIQPIKPADVPKLPAPLPKRPANVSSALDLALAQVCAFVAYGLKADPLLRVSAGLPPLEASKYPECER